MDPGPGPHRPRPVGGPGDTRCDYVQNAPVFIHGGPGIDTIVVIGTPISDVFIITDTYIAGAGRIVSFTGVEAVEVDGAGGDDIISIGALRIVNGRLLQQESFERLLRPRRAVSPWSMALHGLSDAMLKDQPGTPEVLPVVPRDARRQVLLTRPAACPTALPPAANQALALNVRTTPPANQATRPLVTRSAARAVS